MNTSKLKKFCKQESIKKVSYKRKSPMILKLTKDIVHPLPTQYTKVKAILMRKDGSPLYAFVTEKQKQMALKILIENYKFRINGDILEQYNEEENTYEYASKIDTSMEYKIIEILNKLATFEELNLIVE